jgi:O-antigen ligase
MSSAVVHRRLLPRDAGWSAVAVLFTALQALLIAPSLLFLATLAAMLLRAPDLDFFCLDRLALGLLVLSVLLRAVVLRQSLAPACTLVWPMAALVGLVFADLLANPFDVTLWSVAIAKFVTPYALFYLAGLTFDSEASVRRLETFTLGVLAYLSFTAIASLAGWNSLIFPRFILDDSLGIHAERARGPFLQAMANGTTITLLGLAAIDAYRRRRLRGPVAAPLLGALPIAILGTKTRAVWLSFVSSLLVLGFTTSSSRVRRICIGMISCTVLAALSLAAGFGETGAGIHDRLTDRGTAEFRMAAYDAGWEMFLDRPLAGWGARGIRTEMENRIEGFRGNLTVVHNTYLEILLEHGMIGFALYAWIMVGLFRLGRAREPAPDGQRSTKNLFQSPCRPLWPLLLGVYLVSATFVVMNYQFVNGLLFTWAGILAHRQKTADVLNG